MNRTIPVGAARTAVLLLIACSCGTGGASAADRVELVQAAGTVTVKGELSRPSNGVLEVRFAADSMEQESFLLAVVAPAAGVAKGEEAVYRFSGTIDRQTRSQLGLGNHKIFVLSRPAGTMGPLSPIGSALNLIVTGKKLPINSLQGFESDCRYYSDQDWRRVVGPLGTCDSRGAWDIRGTTEDAAFLPTGFFLPDDANIDSLPASAHKRAYWTYAFVRSADGRYSVRWNLDKTAAARDVSRYSGAFLSLGAFHLDAKLSDPLFADIRLRIDSADALDDAEAGAAKIRTTVGVVTHWTSSEGQRKTIFLETNLFRSPNFDLCKERNMGGARPDGYCDSRGIYDRRNYFNVGEIVYYDVGAIEKTAGMFQKRLEANGVSAEFRLPVARLFRQYAWTEPPTSWNEPRIEGMYLGHEIWGRGKVEASFESMRVYRFLAD